MYAYISGKIAAKSPTQAIIDVNGIGYEINISLHTYSELEGHESAKLWIHLAVKEDDMSLFGFAKAEERTMFRKLIQVSGIGTNTARLILSGLRVDEVREGILYEDVALFQQVKGIGKKTAQRLILDLKDKVDDIGGGLASQRKKETGSDNRGYEEALSGLMILGYKKKQVTKALQKVRRESADAHASGEIIKLALKILS